MGRKKVIVNGKEFANHGIKRRSEDQAAPKKCIVWSTTREDELPAKVDLRSYMTEVENQANSNSCCANAVAGAYEYLCKRKALESGDEIGDISRLFIYYVGRKQDQVKREEGNIKVKDEGMSIAGAISAMQLKGACLQEEFPFDLENVNSCPGEEAFTHAMDYKVSDAVSIPVDVEAMKSCLAEGYPIVFGLKLTAQFFEPLEGGYVPVPDPPQSAEHGLHAMLIVGYNERQQLFIVRNSWGTDWGSDGYVYLPYGYVACEDFNFLGQYAIKGLTDYDLTPDEDDEEDFLDGVDPADLDGDGIPDIEQEEDDDEDDEEDDEFDPDDMFSEEAELKRVFDTCDADGSGAIDKGELALLLARAGVSLVSITSEMLEELMAPFDEDDSGTLNFDEFRELVTACETAVAAAGEEEEEEEEES